jgi:hypothetical protein
MEIIVCKGCHMMTRRQAPILTELDVNIVKSKLNLEDL